MKLDKAVEILKAMHDKTHVHDELDINEALTLGIEALERLRHFRNRTLFTVRSPLQHEDVEPRYPLSRQSFTDSPE